MDTVTIQLAQWNSSNPNGQLHVIASSSAGEPMSVYYWDPATGLGPFIGHLSANGSGFFNPPLGKPVMIQVNTSTASAVAPVTGEGATAGVSL